ncbi:MAG: EamA family transporter RarD [Bifidobacteriaceae bacterium]|jgi:chloramphenicol-sensitive protein RarD|nr:EamA family transporter RarD [Bifidobacteriaceae bacterium]
MPKRRPGAGPASAGSRAGFGFGVSAYLMWGVLPLYLSLTRQAGAVEVIAHRVIWSALLCLGIIAAGGQWRALRAVARSGRAMGALSLAAILLTGNWLVFVWAIFNGQLVDAALGYFINPLVSVLLGVVFLGERLRVAQWAAVATAAGAVVVMTLSLGAFPWVALALAISFGLYGYIEKRVGGRVSAVVSLTVETLLVLPLAAAYALWLAAAGAGTFPALGWGHSLALAGLGVATAAPLLAFNAAARRLPLSVLGFVQYLCPVMHFITGLLFFHEPMSAGRWFGFAAVWVALAILSADGVWHARRAGAPRARPASPAEPARRPRPGLSGS